MSTEEQDAWNEMLNCGHEHHSPDRFTVLQDLALKFQAPIEEWDDHHGGDFLKAISEFFDDGPTSSGPDVDA